MRLKPKLNKVSVELRFKPKLASWENTLFLAQILESEFPDWQIDQGRRTQIVLFSREDKEFLKVGYNSLVYVNESIDNISRFLKFLKSVSAKFEENDIEIYLHLGCRNLSFFETELNYPELSEIIFEKFYGSQKRLREISAGEVRDVAYTLDGEKNGFQNHCRLGPMLKPQMIETFKSGFDIGEANISEDKTYLYLDVDIYTIDPKVSNLRNAIDSFEKVYEENKRIFGEYLNFIKQVGDENSD